MRIKFWGVRGSTPTPQSENLRYGGNTTCLEVQTPDGTKAYTRDGNLKTASDGRITTSDGLVLQGGFQPIPAGTTSITIAPTGEVTATGASGSQSFRVQLVRFSNPCRVRIRSSPDGERITILTCDDLSRAAPIV
jgi:hypothetical protein